MSNKGDQKGDLRAGRLSLKHTKHDEEVMHNDFLRECRKKCDPIIREFVECSKRTGLLVVFKCRAENRAMSECLRPLTSDAEYAKWKQRNGITSTVEE